MIKQQWKAHILVALFALAALVACGQVALSPDTLTMPPAPLVPIPPAHATPSLVAVSPTQAPTPVAYPARTPILRSTPTPRPRTVARSSPATPTATARASPSTVARLPTTTPTATRTRITTATSAPSQSPPPSAAALVGCAGDWDANAASTDFQEDLRDLLDEYQARGVGTAGVVIADEAGEPIVAHCADRSFETASLYKLFVLWAVQRAIADGDLRDNTPLTFLPEDDNSAEDGYLLWAYGEQVSVAELRELMIVASNNSAAWLLARTVGWENIDRLLRDHDYATSRVLTGVSTPREIARYFAGMQQGDLDPDLRRTDYLTMLDLLHDQQINGYLSPGFPPGTPFAHKTGNLPGVINDAGIVTLPDGRTLTIVAMIDGDESASFALLESIAALVWAYYGE